MHYNIKSIIKDQGFDTSLPYQNIYIHLFKALKGAILSGKLNENDKLPPSRLMAKDLEIARSTVLKAYDMLKGQGFAMSRPGSGIYIIKKHLPKDEKHLNKKSSRGSQTCHLSKLGLEFEKRLETNSSNDYQGVAFRPGLPPLDQFPILKWQTLSNEYWKTVRNSELTYSNSRGLRALRNTIANYLKIYRNIDCDPDQIIITSGSLHSLYLATTAMINEDDEIVIENPMYPKALRILEALKAKINYASIDHEGINLKSFEHKQPKLLYTTPSNQYPSGVKMSMERRKKLMDWVHKGQTMVIEDDYDHEFSNWGNPLPSIYSMDTQERVIYLGTFNKLLHPSLRVGYMIAPNSLLNSILAIHQYSSRFISPYIQKTLNAFIEKDYLNDHLRNLIEVVARRRKIFSDYFDCNLDSMIQLERKTAGLHLIGKLKVNVKDRDLSLYLSKNGIATHALSDYYRNPNEANGLVMGYCPVNEQLMLRKLNLLSRLLTDFMIKAI